MVSDPNLLTAVPLTSLVITSEPRQMLFRGIGTTFSRLLATGHFFKVGQRSAVAAQSVLVFRLGLIPRAVDCCFTMHFDPSVRQARRTGWITPKNDEHNSSIGRPLPNDRRGAIGEARASRGSK